MVTHQEVVDITGVTDIKFLNALVKRQPHLSNLLVIVVFLEVHGQ